MANATTLLDDPNSGEGDIPPGEYGSFTAASAPEPGSLALLGTGLLGDCRHGAEAQEQGLVAA